MIWKNRAQVSSGLQGHFEGSRWIFSDQKTTTCVCTSLTQKYIFFRTITAKKSSHKIIVKTWKIAVG